MTTFDWQLRTFEDVRGVVRVVRTCPPLQLDELRDYLELLQEAIQSLHPDFRIAYIESSYVQQTSHHCLRLCTIEPDWLNLDMLVALLHHTTDDKGKFAPSLILQLNFDKGKEGKGSKAVSFKEWCAELVASLVSLGLAADLQTAMQLASTIPADQLDAIASAKLFQSNPKLRQQQELEDAAAQFKPEQVKKMLDFSNSQWDDNLDLRDFQ